MKQPTDKPAPKASQPASATQLPTHGGVYEYHPASQTMRAIEGGPPVEAPAAADTAAPSATTGEQT